MGWNTRLFYLLDDESRRRMLALKHMVPIPKHEAPPLGTPRDSTRLIPQIDRSGCADVLQNQCTRLNVTPKWVVACFLPAYAEARMKYDDVDMVVDAIYSNLSYCLDPATPPTPAALELARRIHLAAALLLRSEGIDARMPMIPAHPPSRSYMPGRQPWIRALLTGWP